MIYEYFAPTDILNFVSYYYVLYNIMSMKIFFYKTTKLTIVAYYLYTCLRFTFLIRLFFDV